MNYAEFKEKIDPFIVVPTPEQENELMDSKNTIHYIGRVGNIINGKLVVPEPLHGDFEIFTSALPVLKERGAKFGKDYIVTCYEKFQGIEIALHAKNSFLSEEDLK